MCEEGRPSNINRIWIMLKDLAVEVGEFVKISLTRKTIMLHTFVKGTAKSSKSNVTHHVNHLNSKKCLCTVFLVEIYFLSSATFHDEKINDIQ